MTTPGSPPGAPPPGGHAPPPGGFEGGFYPPPGAYDPNAGGPPGYPPPIVGWSPVDAIVFGWNALNKNLAGIGLGIGIAFAVIFVPGQVIGMIGAGLTSATGERAFGSLSRLVSTGVGIVLEALLLGGVIESALRTARGEIVALGDVFNGYKYFVPFLIATLLYSIAVGIGTLLCLVPGIILALGLGLYGQLIVDRGLNGVDALKASWELTMGHKVQLLVYALLCVPVLVAGALLCGVGALFGSLPVIILSSAYIYLKLRGQEPRLPA